MNIVVEQNKEECSDAIDKKILQERNKCKLEEGGKQSLSGSDENDEIWIWIEKL